jgi:hypothetical protein
MYCPQTRRLELNNAMAREPRTQRSTVRSAAANNSEQQKSSPLHARGRPNHIRANSLLFFVTTGSLVFEISTSAAVLIVGRNSFLHQKDSLSTCTAHISFTDKPPQVLSFPSTVFSRRSSLGATLRHASTLLRPIEFSYQTFRYMYVYIIITSSSSPSKPQKFFTFFAPIGKNVRFFWPNREIFSLFFAPIGKNFQFFSVAFSPPPTSLHIIIR